VAVSFSWWEIYRKT